MRPAGARSDQTLTETVETEVEALSTYVVANSDIKSSMRTGSMRSSSSGSSGSTLPAARILEYDASAAGTIPGYAW